MPTIEIGYALTSELHSAPALVRQAQMAEAAGFRFALISDHFTPFFNPHDDVPAESPFIWSVIGAIAQSTTTLRLGSGVTCPLFRYHPAIIAQAAATCETLMPGRFFLGLGTGANVNEHVVGGRWPSPGERVAMLAEAVRLIRRLWSGELVNARGPHFQVDQARLYSLPAAPPPLYLAASGPVTARLAAELGDGLIGLGPDRRMLDLYAQAGGADRPRFAQIAVCWGETAAAARQTAYDWWPLGLIPGAVIPELALPAHFDALRRAYGPADIERAVACGPDPAVHLARLQTFSDAGYTHLYIHQVGPDQEAAMRFYADQILPHFQVAR
jgi:G6PDH family F420-dependent oxidoreductase